MKKIKLSFSTIVVLAASVTGVIVIESWQLTNLFRFLSLGMIVVINLFYEYTKSKKEGHDDNKKDS